MNRRVAHVALLGYILVVSAMVIRQATGVIAFMPQTPKTFPFKTPLTTCMAKNAVERIKRVPRLYTVNRQRRITKESTSKLKEKTSIPQKQKVFFPLNSVLYHTVVVIYFYIAACMFLYFTFVA